LLKRQIKQRGPVPDEAWQTPRRRRIAEQIEEILSVACWAERLVFHPVDSWSIIGAFEIGDMSELDAVCRIEKRFGVELCNKQFGERVAAGLTFGELVTLIEQQGTQLPP